MNANDKAEYPTAVLDVGKRTLRGTVRGDTCDSRTSKLQEPEITGDSSRFRVIYWGSIIRQELKRHTGLYGGVVGADGLVEISTRLVTIY